MGNPIRGAGTALCLGFLLGTLQAAAQPADAADARRAAAHAATTTTTTTTVTTNTVNAAERARALACIQVVQMNLRYLQQMTENFLEVAYPMDAAANRVRMATNVELFDASLTDLNDGNASRLLVRPTSTEMIELLKKTRKSFDPYKKLLLDNIATVTKKDYKVLQAVDIQSLQVQKDTDALYEAYTGLALVSGIAEAPTRTYARRAALYFDTMRKQSFFVALDVHTEYYLAYIMIEDVALKEIRDSLLYGNQVAGVPEVDQKCILMPFYPLARALDSYTIGFDDMQQTKSIPENVLKTMVKEGKEVIKQLDKILDLFDLDDKSCDANAVIDNDGWFNLVVASNTQAMLTQRASRIFFQLSRGLEVTQKGIDAIMQDLIDVQKTTRKLFKGAYTENIPTPPTQKIVDALAASREAVLKYKDDITTALELRQFTADVTGPCAILKDIVWNRLSFIADYYVDAAIAANPSMRSVYWGVSRRQPALYCKSTSEALLVSMNVNGLYRLGVWTETTRMWQEAHWQLLKGRNNGWSAVDPEAMYKSLPMTRCTDACTLTTMAEVKRRFDQLMALHAQVKAPAMAAGLTRRLAAHENMTNSTQSTVNNDDNLDLSGLLLTSATNLNSEQVLLTAVQRIDTVSLHATNAALQAVSYFRGGYGTCTKDEIGPLGVFMGHIFDTTQEQWEVALQYSGNLPFTLQKAMTEYYLLASGHAQQWLNRSHNALAAHQGYIAEEAAAPGLVDALTEFKRTWDSYKGTDEERALGLRVAYISNNPNPVGQKDRLDIADGPEEYHQAHLRYHPIYRKILYERGYHDLFMFDLTGNLVYSVYKQLDYGTNFRAKGNGVWKDSGLGDSFEAAIASPDKINVVDWKPYGPAGGIMSSFLSTGVRQRDGRLLGVFATELPPEAKPFDSLVLLSDAIRDLDASMLSFKFGESFKGQVIVPPPNQGISDKLFLFGDQWNKVRITLSSSLSWAGVATLVTNTAALIGAAETFLQTYATSATAAAPELESSRIVMVSAHRQSVQSMCSQAVLIGMEGKAATTQGSRTVLAAEVLAFEARHTKLVESLTLSGRRLAGISNVFLSNIVEGVTTAWTPMKTTLTRIAQGAVGSATDTVLWEVVTQTDTLAGEVEKVFTALATTTRTTTLMTVEILAPMPFSGDWTAGPTMKVSSLLAQGLINEQQNVLRGFNLVSVFFDDKCNSVESSQLVLGEMARKDTYVALGGAGCSAVCESVSFLAQTQNLPFLSYDCAAASLSDTSTYPTITRFGTVTTAAVDVLKVIGDNYSWPEITLISGDRTKYGTEADVMQSQFVAQGFSSTYESAKEDQWNEIKDMMQRLKVAAKGKDRVYFLIGTEDYFRKIICASIVAEAEPGITWLSRGAFTDDWWTKTDTLAGLNKQWMTEEGTSMRLKGAQMEFKAAWDVYTNRTAMHRQIALGGLYGTPARENLDVAICGNQDCPEAYHAVHKKWHPVYRALLREKGYFDIYIFDLQGDLMYTVYKDTDFATNFALDGQGQWRNTGLGDAFRTSVENPDNVSYTDWKPYGPAGGALAAFMSTGIREPIENAVVGVYAIQLPTGYQRSIEETEPDCSLDAITNSFEGAINIVGYGRPTEDKMVTPLPCFEGHSPQSFLGLLDQHLLGGYPLGDKETIVERPYGEIKAQAADAVCVVAFTVKHLLEQGHTIEEIQRPDTALYMKFVTHIKESMDFQGASGQVKFHGNDKPNYLVVQQVQQGSATDVGLVNPIIDYATQDKEEIVSSMLTWINAGPDGSMWKKEKADAVATDDFPYWTIQVFVPSILMCVPSIAGIINGWRAGKQENVNLASSAATKK